MKKHRSVLCCCALILLFPIAAISAPVARTITVGKSGPPNYDFASLQAVHSWLHSQADSLALPLQIQLYSSEYPESTLVWSKTGTESAPIKILGVGRVFFSGERIKSANYGKPVLVISWASHITLENVGFRDFDARQESRVALKVSGKGQNTIRRCRFSNFWGPKSEAAISLYNNASGNLIEQCEFDSLGDDIFMHAVYLNKNCQNNIIRDNIVFACSGEAFMVRNGSNNNRFDGNTVIRCGGVAYYGEWYDQSVNPPEVPSRGNRITRARGLGPAAKSSGYVRSGYIRKVRALNWSRYKWPNFQQDWSDTTLAYYMPDANENQLITVAADMGVQIKSEIGDSPGYLRLTNSLIYHAQIEPEGFLDGARLEMIYADTTNRWGGNESYLREVRIHDSSNRPRRYTTPLRLRTLEGDLIGEIVPVRQLAGSAAGPMVVPIEGADQEITCSLTGLQGDYDLFILPESKSLRSEQLRTHFKDIDGGIEFFAKNAVQVKPPMPQRAASRNSGRSDEAITLRLEKGKKYSMVISRKRNEKGACTWSAKP